MEGVTIQMFPEGKIDIHNREAKYREALDKLESDTTLIEENRKLISQFLRDCTLGKTVIGRSKKKIGAGRCLKYLGILRQLSSAFGKSFEEITQIDMEHFVEDLEHDKLKKRNGKPFSDATKCDIKKATKKFWKWKDGKNKAYPELVEWIDTYESVRDVSALRKDEIERMVDLASSIRNKALIMVLFDSGARIEELLNVRLKPEHVFWKDDAKCFKIRLEYSKTKPRTISVPLCTRYLEQWLRVHPGKDNSLAQLFPMKYAAVKMTLNRLGKRALGKRVAPHMLRHSSVTYYAPRLKNRYQLCYRYGWAMSSKVVDRYLDREGIMEEETPVLIKTDEIGTVNKENSKLKEELSLLRETNSQVMGQLNELKVKLEALENGKGLIKLLLSLRQSGES